MQLNRMTSYDLCNWIKEASVLDAYLTDDSLVIELLEQGWSKKEYDDLCYTAETGDMMPVLRIFIERPKCKTVHQVRMNKEYIGPYDL